MGEFVDSGRWGGEVNGSEELENVWANSRDHEAPNGVGSTQNIYVCH